MNLAEDDGDYSNEYPTWSLDSLEGDLIDLEDSNDTAHSTEHHHQNETAFWLEFLTFLQTWNKLVSVYTPLELVILSLGLIGNLLAFVTLLRSKNMCTPSFMYHRVLVLADLLFCLNYFFLLLVDNVMTVNYKTQFVFGSWFAAFFSGVIYHAVHTTCSYVILYMTIAIAFERFVALLMFRHYLKFNRPLVAKLICSICVFLSIVVHSWAPWLQHRVVQHPIAVNSTRMGYTWVKRQRLNAEYVYVKDIYNTVLRIAFPFLVSSLTAFVICGFAKRQRQIFQRYRRASIRATGNQRSRYERTLFLFMVAVILLAFLQIAATEGRRILKLMYPPGLLIADRIGNVNLPEAERLYYFRILLYGFQVSRIVSNLCTAANHCLVCYLYVAMNKLFRREVMDLLCCRPAIPAGQIRPRTLSSYNANCKRNNKISTYQRDIHTKDPLITTEFAR